MVVLVIRASSQLYLLPIVIHTITIKLELLLPPFESNLDIKLLRGSVNFYNHILLDYLIWSANTCKHGCSAGGSATGFNASLAKVAKAMHLIK